MTVDAWKDYGQELKDEGHTTKSCHGRCVYMCVSVCACSRECVKHLMMIVLLLFLQKQSLAFAVYLFGIGTLHTGPGLKKKHM
jgi:hypothetical protein